MDCIVFVKGLPIVKTDKFEKLLRATFSKCGELRNDDNGGVYMPLKYDQQFIGDNHQNQKKLSLGICLIQFLNSKAARTALLLKYFDKNHPLEIHLLRKTYLQIKMDPYVFISI